MQQERSEKEAHCGVFVRASPAESVKGNNAECAACMLRDCECGYGPPATITSVEQAEQDVYYESHQTPVSHGATFSGVRTLYPKRSAGRIAMSEDGSLLAVFGQQQKMASIWSTGDSLEEIYSFESSKVIPVTRVF